MNFLSPIDIYCERTDASFWSEPVNALSNAGFLLAAYFLWRAYKKTGTRDWVCEVLIALVALIGVGSFLFHSFANVWSMMADVIPIATLIWFYLFAYLRRFLNAGLLTIIAAYAAFAVTNIAINRFVPGETINYSQIYLPALLALATMGIYLWRRGDEYAAWYGRAAMAFTASLIFRILDNAVCDTVPIGTHFMWHVLNAATLYCVVRAVLPSAALTNGIARQ